MAWVSVASLAVTAVGAYASRKKNKEQNKLENRTSTTTTTPNMVYPLDFLDTLRAQSMAQRTMSPQSAPAPIEQSAMPSGYQRGSIPGAPPALPAGFDGQTEDQKQALKALLAHFLGQRARLGLGDPTLPPKEY